MTTKTKAKAPKQSDKQRTQTPRQNQTWPPKQTDSTKRCTWLGWGGAARREKKPKRSRPRRCVGRRGSQTHAHEQAHKQLGLGGCPVNKACETPHNAARFTSMILAPGWIALNHFWPSVFPTPPSPELPYKANRSKVRRVGPAVVSAVSDCRAAREAWLASPRSTTRFTSMVFPHGFGCLDWPHA